MSDWISVEDRLPENGQDVLLVHMIRDDASSIMSGWVDNNYWFENCYYGKAARIPASDITHWMPLPSPPNKRNEHE